jgi:hypothetical protein
LSMRLGAIGFWFSIDSCRILWHNLYGFPLPCVERP